MDDLARARVRRLVRRSLATEPLCSPGRSTKETVLEAFDALELRSQGHCGGRRCRPRLPRQALGVCGCRCADCRAAEAVR